MGRISGISMRAALARGVGICAATMLLLASTGSAAFALSESPAAGSSPAAAPAAAPSGGAPAGAPATRLVPSDEGEPPTAAPASEAGAAGSAAPTAKKPRTHRKTVAAAPDVEPGTARLKVIQDGWIYAAPAKSSKKIQQATVGKFVEVTGSTKYYLQAKLKDGQVGYISPSNVDLVKPTDKIFLLSQDAAVLEAPNRWARKLAEVHRRHNVHVIGIALNYLRIRMKSGLTGFISLTAVQ